MCSGGEVSLAGCAWRCCSLPRALLSPCVAPGSKGRAAAFVHPWVHEVCSRCDCQAQGVVQGGLKKEKKLQDKVGYDF